MSTINHSEALDPLMAIDLDASYIEEKRIADQERAIRKWARDAARNRRMIDITPNLESKIEWIAADIGVSVSQLICYLLIRGMDIVTKEELIEARRTWRSSRFEYCLELPQPEEALESD